MFMTLCHDDDDQDHQDLVAGVSVCATCTAGGGGKVGGLASGEALKPERNTDFGKMVKSRKKTCKKMTKTHKHCGLNQKTGFNESQEPVRRAHLKKPLSSTGLAVAEAARRRTRLKIFVETEGDIVQTDLCWTAMRTPLRGLL